MRSFDWSEFNACVKTLRERKVSSDDRTLLNVRHSRTDGEHPVCVLIHGSGDGSYIWDESIASLIGRLQLALVDLRGHGDSEHPKARNYDLATHVADVMSIVREFGWRKIILVGHSFGGLIAVHLAGLFLRAEMLGVMLVDVPMDPNPECSQHVLVSMQDSMRTYETPEEYCEWLLARRPLLSVKTARTIAMGALRRVDCKYVPKLDPSFVDAGRLQEEDLESASIHELLRNINCPTAIVRGSGSAMVRPDVAQRMSMMLPAGRLLTIPCAGHAVMSDNPVAFTAVLTDFLRSLNCIVAN